MADVQQTYRFKFEFDRKDVKAQLKDIALDVKEAIVQMSDASDKVVIFKNLVSYLSNVDKALDAFKIKHKSDFANLFGSSDADLTKLLETIFGTTQKAAQGFVVLKDKIAEAASSNADLSKLRSIAEEINSLFVSVGKTPPININEMFTGKGSKKAGTDFASRIGLLNNALDEFGKTYAGIQDKLKNGFSIDGTSGVSGLDNVTKEAQEKIDVLKKQKAELQEVLETINNPKKIKISLPKKSNDQIETLQNYVNEFKAAKKELDRLQLNGIINGDEYLRGNANYIQAAAKLKKAFDMPSLSNEASYFINGSDNLKFYNTAEKDLNEFYSKQKETLTGIQNLFSEKISGINAEIERLSQPAKNLSGVYDNLKLKVQEYYDIVNQRNVVEPDSSKYNALTAQLDDIAASIKNIKSLNKDDMLNLTDVFGDIEYGEINSVEEALTRICDILKVEPSSTTEGVFAKITSDANEATKAVKNVMYHLGNLLNGKGMSRDTFGDMTENLTTAAAGTRYEKYGFGVLGGGLFGVADPSTIDIEPSRSTFIQSVDLSKYNMYMADTEERAVALIDFLSKLQKFSMKSAEPNYTGFDAQLQGVGIDDLYKQFQVVFDQTELTKEQFQSFINEMTSILRQAGLVFNKETGKLGYNNLTAEIANSENISTRFMKMLGYQGVNVGTTSFDGLGQGSVLFDFDKVDIVGYFNSVKEAVEDYRKILSQSSGDEWVGSIEQLKQYASNIDEITAKLLKFKNSGALYDVNGVDETLNKLTQIRRNIDDIISGKDVSGNTPFQTITTGSANVITSTEQAKAALQEFFNLTKEIQDQSFYSSSTEGNVAIGQYTERLETARAALLAFGDAGELTAGEIEKVNAAFQEAQSHLLGHISYYDGYGSGYGDYSYTYAEEYHAAESENERLRNDLKLSENEYQSAKEENERLRQELTEERQRQSAVGQTQGGITSEDDKGNANIEIQQLEHLKSVLFEVEQAVQAKTQAFKEEGDVVEHIAIQEVQAFKELLLVLESMQSAIGIINNGFANIKAAYSTPSGTHDSNSDAIAKDPVQAGYALESTLQATNGILKTISEKIGNNEHFSELIEPLKNVVAELKNVASGIVQHQKNQQVDRIEASTKIANNYGQLSSIAENAVNSIGDGSDDSVKIKGMKSLADNIVRVEGAVRDASGSWNGFIVDINEANQATIIATNTQSEFVKELNATVEASKRASEATFKTADQYADQYKRKSKERELQKITGQVNYEKNSLGFDFNARGLNSEQNEIVAAYDALIAEIDKYEIAVKNGNQVELDGINKTKAALFQKIDAYKQQYSIVNAGKTGNKKAPGATVAKNATSKYNHLTDMANTEELKGSAVVQQALAQYTAAYQKLIDLQKQYKVGQTLDSNEEQEFNDARVACSQYARELEKLLNTYQKSKDNAYHHEFAGDFTDNIEGRKKAFQEFLEVSYGADATFEKFDDNFNKMTYTVNNGDGTFTKMTASINNTRTAIDAVAGETKEATSAFKSFWNETKGKFRSLASYVTAYITIYDFIRVIRQGVTYIKEIDSALTELKKVTDETEATYDKFLNTASKTAGKLGSTVADFTNATADFARLGYNIEQAADLAKAASVYKNVGDGIDDVSAASESIISTMKAFGIEAENAMGIVDRFNEVGNNFAISSTGIGEAMQRSASALYEAGNTIDESIALITGANSVIQNPEQVGTALKTLALRLRGAKVELEEAGLETEGMVESTSSLQAKLKALTHGKVDIMLDANTFKNTTEILREMSQAWEDMTDIERASALELMGGKRQANILSSLIKNFDTVEDVIETSSESSGSALRENEKYLDSIQGKIDQFSNSLQTMWMNFLNTDFVKFVIDAGNALLKVVDNIGLVKTALMGVIAYITLAKKTSVSEWLLGGNFLSFGKKSKQNSLQGSASTADIDNSNVALQQGSEALEKYESATQSANKATNTRVKAIGRKIVKTKESTAAVNGHAKAVKQEAAQTQESVTAVKDHTSAVEQETVQTKKSVTAAKGRIQAIKQKIFKTKESAAAVKQEAAQIQESTAAVKGHTSAVEHHTKVSKKASSITGSQIGVMFKSMMIMHAITTAIELVGKGISTLTEKMRESSKSAEVLQEKYVKATEELDACNSELSSFESELTSTNEKIEELMSQGTLSFVEQEELNRLRAVSDELEKQISMTKTLQSSLQLGVNAAAYNAGDAYLGTSFSSKESKTERQQKAEEEGKEIGTAAGLGVGAAVGIAIALGVAGFFSGGASWAGIPAALSAGAGTIATSAGIGSIAGGTIFGAIGSAKEGAVYDQEQTVKAAINSMNATRDQLIDARDEAHAAYASDPGNDELKDAYQNTVDDLMVYDETMAGHISQMQQYYNTIITNWEKASDDQKQLAIEFGDYLDAYNITMGGIDAEKTAIDRAFGKEATEEIQAAKAELQKMAENGEKLDWTKAFGNSKKSAQEFIDRMYSLGVYVYQMEDYFYDLADAEQAAANVNFSEIAKDIIGIADAISGLKTALEEFNEKGYATPQTLIDLKESIINNNSSEELKNLFEEYSEAMLSGTASVQDALDVTEDLAQQYIEEKIALGELTDEQKLTYVHLLKHDLGINNAEEFVEDRLQAAGLQKIQDEFNNYTINDEAPDWTSDDVKNNFAASDAIQETIKQYGLEADAIDLIIQKLIEKKSLEEDRDSEKDDLESYNKFINGTDNKKGFGKLKQDYEQYQKIVKDLEEADVTFEEVKEFNAEEWKVLDTPSRDARGVTEWIKGSWLDTTTISNEKYQALKSLHDEYAGAMELLGDFVADDYTDALENGIDKGFLTTNGEISREIEQGFQDAYNAAQDAVDNLDKEIEAEFTVEYDLEFANKSGPNTLAGLTNEVEQYKSAMASIDEIGFDGQRLTEEQFAALQAQLEDVTDGTYDLFDAIDVTDGYAIKNVNILKDLVDASKKATAQNIKLARSQAKLKYYEKYKELQKLTNGQKITNAATLSHVKTIYAEMAALQKSISRYNMLEHQLLGATNAYEEFAKAQEIDAANDYESKAEELVGYLVDAFQTGKLGAESAQAAIMGLVPESVYDDLDTLDEKMEAVYKYFTEDLSKYFYVKFNEDGSLESAEMLVDNVKQFVEDGIANGVFTGSWEEWDLSSTITSLDDLAEKMGVTKEVAYAFLQAMETYDISWIGGDASTLLDKLVPSTTEIQTIKDQMQEAFNQTPIDLSARVKVSAEKMREAGYTDFEDEYATVYSTSINSGDFGLYNEDGSSYEILATPILPNGDVLSSDGLVDYINSELDSGKKLNEIDVFIGAYASVEEANEAAQVLHEAQAYYYDKLKSYNLENAIAGNIQKQAELEYKIGTGQIDADTIVSADGVTTASQQLAQLRTESEANAQAARDNVSAWMEANEEYEEQASAFESLNRYLEKAKENNNPIKVDEISADLEIVEGKMWDAYETLTMLGEPTEVVLTVAMEQVQKDLENIEATMNDTELDIVSQLDISNLERGADGHWIVDLDAYSNLDEDSKSKIQTYLNYLEEEHNINILQGDGATTTLDVLTDIKNILSQTYELMVDTDDAETKTKSFSDIWNGIKDKSVTLTQSIKSFFTGDGADANGTAHVRGTAFAGGSWGAPRTETALTGELGPEILVRNGRWTTVGENGAEFTQVKKGDIIFNHKQSEQLLKHGYVTGRGKAYASGTAYEPGSIHPWLGGMGNINSDWQNITPTLWNDATNGEYLEDAMDDAADSANEFEETLDWIEIRLEEINEQLDLMNAQLENASDYSSKNNIIDQMIDVNANKMANLTAGIKKYSDYAAKLLVDVPDQYREAAQNGAIDISEFVGEANEKTVEAINKYREWAQKVADLKQELEGVKTEIRDLARQKFDNAYNSGDVKATVEDSQTEKLQDAVDYDETRGLIADPSHYVAMMENSERKIAYLTPALNAMQKELDEAVKTGKIVYGSDEWYEWVDQMYQMQAEINGATMELEEFQNKINDIYWDAFDELVNRFDYISEEAQGLIDIMESADMVSKPDDENGWSADDVEWTTEGLATLGLHAQKMEQAEDKAKAYAVAIDELDAEYKAGHYSESEYYEKLNELTQGQYDAIKAAQDEKEAIVNLNKQRIDAIKEGIKKEIEAYEELIEKKKEELQTEKDLYDFQKSAMDQQKNIADIQRKLAALSGDNSASAVAKRKQLEAELAEAREEQEELYYDRSIENQQDALDKELESFQEEKDAEIDKWEKYLEDVEAVVTESLGIVQANATEIGATLTEKTEEYSLKVSDAVLSPWKEGSSAIDDYTTKFGDSVSSTTAQLETIRAAWQKVKKELAAANAEADKYYKAGTAEGKSVEDIYAENERYVEATYAPPATTNNNANTNSPSTTQPKAAPSVGSTVTVKKSATHFGSKSSNAKMASFVPGGSYTVYQISGSGNNAQVLIGKNGSYTGWVKLTDLNGYAKGTTGVDEDQWAWLDELGEELVLNAGPDGRLQYLSKGSSVLTHDLTERLMDLAMNPQEVLDRNRPTIAPSKSVVNNNMEISVDASVGTLIHVDHLDGNNPDDIVKIVNKAYDKKMQELNNSLKKFVR